MRKKANTLPESLELLLDTMCNTFGGIMFIAIALTIVMQISNEQLKILDQDMITAEEKDRMHEQMERLTAEVEKTEREQRTRALQENLLNPESRQLIEKLLETRKTNAAALNIIAQEKEELQKTKEKLRKEQSELEREKYALQQSILDNEKLSQSLSVRSKMAAEQLERLQKQLKNIEETVAVLQEALNQGPPKETMTFSMETETSAREYLILLSNGRFYREANSSEVDQNSFLDILQLKPTGSGWNITPGENQPWQRAMDSIDRRYYYIRLVVDDNSLNSFLEMKKYLRKRQFLVTWSYNPDFTFRLVEGVSIKVSH